MVLEVKFKFSEEGAKAKIQFEFVGMYGHVTSSFCSLADSASFLRQYSVALWGVMNLRHAQCHCNVSTGNVYWK